MQISDIICPWHLIDEKYLYVMEVFNWHVYFQ